MSECKDALKDAHNDDSVKREFKETLSRLEQVIGTRAFTEFRRGISRLLQATGKKFQPVSSQPSGVQPNFTEF